MPFKPKSKPFQKLGNSYSQLAEDKNNNNNNNNNNNYNNEGLASSDSRVSVIPPSRSALGDNKQRQRQHQHQLQRQRHEQPAQLSPAPKDEGPVVSPDGVEHFPSNEDKEGKGDRDDTGTNNDKARSGSTNEDKDTISKRLDYMGDFQSSFEHAPLPQGSWVDFSSASSVFNTPPNAKTDVVERHPSSGQAGQQMPNNTQLHESSSPTLSSGEEMTEIALEDNTKAAEAVAAAAAAAEPPTSSSAQEASQQMPNNKEVHELSSPPSFSEEEMTEIASEDNTAAAAAAAAAAAKPPTSSSVQEAGQQMPNNTKMAVSSSPASFLEEEMTETGAEDNTETVSEDNTETAFEDNTEAALTAPSASVVIDPKSPISSEGAVIAPSVSTVIDSKSLTSSEGATAPNEIKENPPKPAAGTDGSIGAGAGSSDNRAFSDGAESFRRFAEKAKECVGNVCQTAQKVTSEVLENMPPECPGGFKERTDATDATNPTNASSFQRLVSEVQDWARYQQEVLTKNCTCFGGGTGSDEGAPAGTDPNAEVGFEVQIKHK